MINYDHDTLMIDTDTVRDTRFSFGKQRQTSMVKVSGTLSLETLERWRAPARSFQRIEAPAVHDRFSVLCFFSKYELFGTCPQIKWMNWNLQPAETESGRKLCVASIPSNAWRKVRDVLGISTRMLSLDFSWPSLGHQDPPSTKSGPKRSGNSKLVSVDFSSKRSFSRKWPYLLYSLRWSPLSSFLFKTVGACGSKSQTPTSHNNALDSGCWRCWNHWIHRHLPERLKKYCDGCAKALGFASQQICAWYWNGSQQ